MYGLCRFIKDSSRLSSTYSTQHYSSQGLHVFYAMSYGKNKTEPNKTKRFVVFMLDKLFSFVHCPRELYTHNKGEEPWIWISCYYLMHFAFDWLFFNVHVFSFGISSLPKIRRMWYFIIVLRVIVLPLLSSYYYMLMQNSTSLLVCDAKHEIPGL